MRVRGLAVDAALFGLSLPDAAPEQADVDALGCLAYLLTTGKIKEGQNFRDLSVSDASKVISKPDLILSKLPAQTVTAEVVNE